MALQSIKLLLLHSISKEIQLANHKSSMDISTLQSNLDFTKSLYFHKEWKDEKCKSEILEAIRECNQKIEEAFGKSIHRLWDHKPSAEAVEKVVQKFPSTLSYIHEEYGEIPIQNAAGNDGFEYIPILAKEGIKRKVGGEDARGGLLLYDSNGMNTLQSLGYFGNDFAMKVNVFKELRRLGLLQKNDIQEYNLLEWTCVSHSRDRFEYLVNWDPDALIETRVDDEPLIHYVVGRRDSSIHLLLKAGFEYHPNLGGILFVKDNEGTTGLNSLCNLKGVDEVLTMLHQILSPSCDYPILHHVFIEAPQHMKLFTEKFPWAYHLKDHNGRTLHQALLAAGPEVMKKHGLLFASLSDNQIQEKDPITTLHPFAAMAVGEHADLDKCYYLLRRQPSVLEKHSRIENNRKRKKCRIESQANGGEKGSPRELNFIKELYSNEEWTERECRDDILAALEEAHTKIEKAFGKSLLRLRDGEHKPSIKAVEKVAKKFPSALSYEDEHGYIPITNISEQNDDLCGVEYIPILAKEGVKLNIGGGDARGGLLSTNPNGEGLNTLQNLYGRSPEEGTVKNLNVLKELRKMGLFVKSDIQEYQLLYYATISSGRNLVEYLADWDPDALLNIDSLEIVDYDSEFGDLEGILKAGFKHFPNIGGILFLQDTAGNTALDLAFRGDYGVEGTMSALHKMLAPRSDYPILHHVYIKAPQHVNLFAKKFWWAYHLKDHKGRTLHQAVLAAGPDFMNTNSQLFALLTDDQLQTKDPITMLYPFAAMAVGEHAELGDIFDLLRRQPSVLERLDV